MSRNSVHCTIPPTVPPLDNVVLLGQKNPRRDSSNGKDLFAQTFKGFSLGLLAIGTWVQYGSRDVSWRILLMANHEAESVTGIDWG